MRASLTSVVVVFIAVPFVAGCSQMGQSTSPTAPSFGPSQALVGPSQTDHSSNSLASVPLNFRAHMSGDQVVPPRDTLAQGEAIFQLSPDGTELSYRVIASNIENVIGAHIHLGAAGVNGPNVFFLFGPGVPAGGGRTNGVLATGTIAAATYPPFPQLINDIKAGNVYIDVNTNDGVSPTNTGPGDFVMGEIRGQLR